VSETSPNIRRVLVTGASGKIAAAILPELSREYEIIPTDLVESDLPGFVAADLTDFDTVYRLMENVDAVVHLAVMDGDGRDENFPPDKLDPVDYNIVRINPPMCFNVLEAASRRRIKRMVYISSMTIILKDPDRPSFTDDMPTDPTNLYACTKLFGEQYAKSRWRATGLSTIILRVGQPTPIGEPFDSIWQKNRRGRSFRVHNRDIAQAVLGALRTPQPFGLYNLVSDSDNPRVDISNAKRDLGYEPIARFEEDVILFRDDPAAKKS